MPRDQTHIFSELLVLQAQAGDEQAIADLVGVWTDRLTKRATQLLGRDDNVHDVVQESWLGIARGLRSLHNPALFGPWAYRIVANKCADAIRKHVAEHKVNHIARHLPRVRDDNTAPQDASTVGVRRAICTLPNDLRDVVMFFYFDGLTVETISVMLEIPVGTVKTRLMRARTRLRPLIEEIL